MELGSWALISPPSILGLLPLLVFIVLALRGVENLSALIISVALGAILLGWDPGMLAQAVESSLNSSPVLIALIMMLGAGIGALMSETKVSNVLVYFIVDRIGVNTRTKAKISLCACSILVSGLLGTSSGGNAVIAPIMLPIMGTLGVTPTVVTALFKAAGEIGLILGPITGVTLMTLEVTGLSYGTYMLQAGIPFAAVWLIGTWVGCIRAQKRTEGYEHYEISDDLKDLSRESISPKQVRATIAFLLLFVILIAYGIITKQGSNYVLIVMVLLAAVLAIFSGTKLETAVSCVVNGARKQTHVLFISLVHQRSADASHRRRRFRGIYFFDRRSCHKRRPRRRYADRLLGRRLWHRIFRNCGNSADRLYVRRNGSGSRSACRLYGAGSPGRHPFDGQHLSYNQFCRSNGNRTVLQHQGGIAGTLVRSRILSGLFSHYGVCWPNYLLDAASPSFTYFLNEDGGRLFRPPSLIISKMSTSKSYQVTRGAF